LLLSSESYSDGEGGDDDSMTRRVSFDFNSRPVEVDTAATTAVDLIRTDLGATGTKLVCGAGTCGACVIQVDGVPVASCLLAIEELEGRSVTTIEGVSNEEPHPIQRALAAHDGLQCGFCTPGFVMAAVAFHDRWRRGKGETRPPREELVRALTGHLCRCGAYAGILSAVEDACVGRFDEGPIAGPRVDAADKVTGRAEYTVDVSLPGMLHGRIVRTPLAHAQIVDVDAFAAMAMPGVEAFVLLLPSDGRVRHVGEGIAAVAASDPATAREAANAVVGHYLEFGTVVGLDDALAGEAPDLHGRGWTPPNSNELTQLPNLRRGNLRGPLTLGSSSRSRARKAISDAAGDPLLVEQRWEFPAQVHNAFEPHACVADWRPDGLTVHVSTQTVSALRRELADRFSLDEERVTIRADNVGGAFGAKQGLNEETVAAVELSRAAGRPVRLVFDRHEELGVAGYRPGGRLDVAMAGHADGSLPPFTSTFYADGGASAGQLIATFHRLTYPGSPRALLDYDVLTNAPRGRPMRAPGGPPAFAAIEGAVDEYARRLGRDPVELRRSWDPEPTQQRLYDWVESNRLWAKRPQPSNERFRLGVGVAFGLWVYFYDPDTTVEVSSTADGFVVTTGSQDTGNGTKTVLSRAVTSELGVDPALVSVDIGTSGLWGPASVGSRTTTSVHPTAARAAANVVERLVGQVRDDLGLTGAEAVPGGVSHAGEFMPWSALLPRLQPVTARVTRPSDERRPLTPFTIGDWHLGMGITRSAHVTRVEVDTRLGSVRTLQVDTALAVGTVHVPDLARSQVEGGVIQGIGYALYEQRLLDPRSALNITTTMDQYRVPGIGDTPITTVDFLDDGFEHSASGSAGLSELATAAVPASVANAVSHATGHRFTRLPIIPERVLEAVR
jgi:xanthine dehydrogenase YagR molybdenum-binding subunit